MGSGVQSDWAKIVEDIKAAPYKYLLWPYQRGELKGLIEHCYWDTPQWQSIPYEARRFLRSRLIAIEGWQLEKAKAKAEGREPDIRFKTFLKYAKPAPDAPAVTS